MRDDAALLADMLDAIDTVLRYTPPDRAVLDTDLGVQSILIRFIQNIGEVAYRVSRPLKDAHPEVAWRAIAAMRHVLVHDYFRVDLDQVYRAATVHVPPLRPQVRAILDSLPPETP